jgi:hypothetical protein
VAGVVCGGIWTFAMFLGESLLLGTGGPKQNEFPYGTLLTAAATLLLIVAGILLLMAGGSSSQGVVATGKKLGTWAFWLAALAAAGYVFGFVVCLTGN